MSLLDRPTLAPCRDLEHVPRDSRSGYHDDVLTTPTAFQLLVITLALGAVVAILSGRKRAQTAIAELRRIHDLRRRATLSAPDLRDEEITSLRSVLDEQLRLQGLNAGVAIALLALAFVVKLIALG